jgi:hypothetical protein
MAVAGEVVAGEVYGATRGLEGFLIPLTICGDVGPTA